MEVITSLNPATGEKIHEQDAFDPAWMEELVAEARIVQQRFWGPLSYKERAAFLKRAQKYLFQHLDEVAHDISLNNGKPLVEAMAAEVVPMIQTVSFAIKKAGKILKDRPMKIGLTLPTKRAYVTYCPVGVVGIISPWNYPLSTPLADVFLGLMAGNAIILKPSEVTGLINAQIQKIIDSMQLPQGLVTMVHGRGDVGAALASSSVDRIVVTGSVSTGKKVMASASHKLTPVTLELGGKDCMIVLDDADIEVASSAAVVGAFYNAGQTCCSVERLLVHEKIAPEFLKAFEKKTGKLRIGESSLHSNELGPITFNGQKKTYYGQLQDHLTHHGQTLFGSTDYDGRANFMKPLVVQGNPDRAFWRDETFGPVVAVRTFKTDEEAIETNNATEFGLTAIIWSKNQNRARKMARKLQTGTVIINDGPFTNAVASLPWGGVKASGFGRVHGEEGLKELCHAKVITYDMAGQQKQFWWYPYGKAQYDFFKNYAILFNGCGIGVRLRALLELVKNLKKMGPRL